MVPNEIFSSPLLTKAELSAPSLALGATAAGVVLSTASVMAELLSPIFAAIFLRTVQPSAIAPVGCGRSLAGDCLIISVVGAAGVPMPGWRVAGGWRFAGNHKPPGFFLNENCAMT